MYIERRTLMIHVGKNPYSAEYTQRLDDISSSNRRVLDQFFQQAGITPRIAMEAENVAIIKPLVKIDLGISLIPLRSVADELKRKELHCLRIRNYKVKRQIGLVYQKSDHVPRIVLEFTRLFKEEKKQEAK